MFAGFLTLQLSILSFVYPLCCFKAMLEHGTTCPQPVVYCTLSLGPHPSTHSSS